MTIRRICSRFTQMTRTSGIRDEFEVYDERFLYLTLGNAWVEKLHTGTLWAEGPVYFADGDYLVWSDIPNNRMLRWAGGHVSVFRDFANNSNGNTRDRQGRLVTCEHGARRVTRTEPDGSITVLVDQFQGKKLNSPNDVVVKSDGTSGLRIRLMGFYPTTKGTSPRANMAVVMSSALILRPESLKQLPRISTSRMGSRFLQMNRSCTLSILAVPTPWRVSIIFVPSPWIKREV